MSGQNNQSQGGNDDGGGAIVYFVGCGPGDPDLITIRAQRLISSADVMIYSGSLIPKEIISMAKDGAALHDASGMTREEITDVLYAGAANTGGGVTVRLHDGDPAIYGAIKEQIDELGARGIGSMVVPGVTSFLASAAALNTQLTLPGVTQTIIITRAQARTKVPESITELARHGATMIFYLSVHLLADIVAGAKEGGYADSTPAAVIYRASWDDEKIVTGTLADIARKTKEAGITRTAIVMIGNVISPESYEYSRLYDKDFSHGYRKAKG